MHNVLRFVILETDRVRGDRIAAELRRVFPRSLVARAETEEAMRNLLFDFPPHVVFSGFPLRQIELPHAIRVVRDLSPETAFLIVAHSAVIDDAVSVLKAGADDFLGPDSGQRLETAVEESLARRRQTPMLPLHARLPYTEEDGLWDWDLRRNEIGYSPRWKAMLGYAPEDLGKRPEEWLSLIHPQDVTRVSEALRSGPSTPQFEVQYRILHHDGRYRWMLARGLVVRDDRARPYRVVGIQVDMTERKEAEELLVYHAAHDALTGLPNRRVFLERLEQTVREAHGRGRSRAAALVLDLDRFRLVNNSYGHLEGDRLLLQFAERVYPCLRPLDTFARLGADTFAVLAIGIDGVDAARQLAAQIQASLSEPFNVAGSDVYLTVSIGIATAEPRHAAGGALLRDADATMHVAKARGGGQCEVFSPGVHERTRRRLETEADLRRGLDAEELTAHYQPTVSLRTGAVVGFEALARWQHPLRGLVLPAEFIPVAEETGLIVPLGRGILRDACGFLRELDGPEANRPLSVSVNLSAREFAQTDLVAQFEAALRDAGVRGSQLRVEITESMVLEDLKAAAHRLAGLKRLGIAVEVDDFGTGFSSLHYLRALPVDAVKIDREFVSQMTSGGKDATIVSSIASLARGLHIECVAEGVSTEEEAVRLRQLGCQRAQGSLFALAVQPEAARALAGKRWTIGSAGEPVPSHRPDPPMLHPLLERLEGLMAPRTQR